MTYVQVDELVTYYLARAGKGIVASLLVRHWPWPLYLMLMTCFLRTNLVYLIYQRVAFLAKGAFKWQRVDPPPALK